MAQGENARRAAFGLGQSSTSVSMTHMEAPHAVRYDRSGSTFSSVPFHSSDSIVDLHSHNNLSSPLLSSRRPRATASPPALMVVLLLGLGSLMPFNALVNGVDYFDYMFGVQQSSMPFEFYVAAAFVLLQPVVAFAISKCATHSQSAAGRASIGAVFVIQSVEMITVPVLASAFPRQQAWWTLLVVTMMLGVQASILQPNLAAFAAEVSSSLYKVLMIAQACSAVCVCAVRVTTKSLLADTPETDGLAFFLAIAGLQLACGAAFVWLTHRPYIQRKLVIDRADSVDTDSTAGFTIRSDSGSSDFASSDVRNAQASMAKLLRPVWREASAVFLSLAVTFSLFPGEITTLWYHGDSWAWLSIFKDYHWWPMVLVAVTCSFNLLGRGLSIPLGRIVGPTLLLVLSAGRLVFIPVFTFYMQGQDQAVMTDSSALIFVAVFAVTNGFIVHSAMNHAIAKTQCYFTSQAMVRVFRLGMFIGAFAGLGVRQLRM